MKNHRGKQYDWSGIDWSLTNAEIRNCTGRAAPTIRAARLRLAPETHDPRPRRPPYDWSKVDWSLPTSEIVKLTGRQQSSVSHARRKHAPDTRYMLPQQGTDWSKVDWSRRNKDLATLYGVVPGTVSTARGRHAPETLRYRSKWPSPLLRVLNNEAEILGEEKAMEQVR